MRTPAPTRSPTVYHRDEDMASPTYESPSEETSKRRKGTSGLRVQNQSSFQEDLSEHQRQMQVDSRSFPKRKKVSDSKYKPESPRVATVYHAALHKCSEDIQATFRI
jgi:ATP-dependent RNA helicase DDX49/DBP8